MNDADAPRDWTLLGSHSAYDGYVGVRRDRYRLPDGSESDWDVVEVGDTVVVVAFTRDDRVVLFDQYRVGPRAVLGELPGGLIDAGEDAVAAGRRELLEETGFAAGAIFAAGAEWSAANASRRAHVLVAADCTPVAPPSWGEHESGRVRLIAASDLIDHLVSGEASDAGASLRGILAFAGTAPVEPALVGLQQRVRELLAAFARPRADASDDAAPDDEPFAAFWRDAEGRDPEDLWRDLESLLADTGADAAVALYERASLHDLLGEEVDAVPLYREALRAGLDGERRPAAVIQLASSLRNLGDPSGAMALLKGFAQDESLSDAARAFEALALFDDDKPAAALRTALRALAPHLPAYRRSVTSYAADLRARPRIRVVSVAVVVDDGWLLAEEYPATAHHGPFLRAPGGGVGVGEDAAAAMRRELREELGVEARSIRQLAVLENLFDSGRSRGHEVMFVFAVDPGDLRSLPRGGRYPVLDGDTTVSWYRLDDLRAGSVPVHPPGILDLAARLDAGAL